LPWILLFDLLSFTLLPLSGVVGLWGLFRNFVGELFYRYFCSLLSCICCLYHYFVFDFKVAFSLLLGIE
jgi:hypothetical protein